MIRLRAIAVLALSLMLASCVDGGRDNRQLDLAKFSRMLGVNLYNIDPKVRPQDDFYRFVNGRWLALSEIPAEQASQGTFTDMIGQTDATLYAIMQDILGRRGEALTVNERMLRDHYLSFLDTDRVEALNLRPLAQLFEQIDAAAGPKELSFLMAHIARSGMDGPVELFLRPDPRGASTYRLQLGQDGLGLPDRVYYLDNAADIVSDPVATLAAYREYVADVLLASNIATGPIDATERAATIFEMESRLAKAHWGKAANRDREKIYNRYSLSELGALTPGIDWPAFFAGLFAGGGDMPEFVIIRQPDYLRALGAALNDISLSAWKDYLKFHVVNSTANLLPARFNDLKFAFYRGRLQGISRFRPLHRRAIAYTNRDLGNAFGQLYVERVFSARARDEVREIADNIREAFGRRIERLNWMSPATKRQALAKLAKLDIKVGYPDSWPDAPDVAIRVDDLFGNVTRLVEDENARHLLRIDGPVDRAEWEVSPQTVNAFYSASTNEIVIPAGLLQPPFFSLDADTAVNYGGIGAIIGHEISHAFDDQGRKSNGDGNLHDWWIDGDSAEFELRAGQLSRQYTGYRPLEGLALNGRQTLGENLGDLGGVEAAYDAYLSLNRKEHDRRIFGFDGHQRFFLGWAQVWRRAYRDEELRRRLITDTHSPPEFRVNGILSNVEAFYDAFGLNEGDALYRPPEDRVSIW